MNSIHAVIAETQSPNKLETSRIVVVVSAPSPEKAYDLATEQITPDLPDDWVIADLYLADNVILDIHA